MTGKSFSRLFGSRRLRVQANALDWEKRPFSTPNAAFYAWSRLEYGGLRGDIVYIRLPHSLHTALPDRNIVPIGKKELLPNLLDVIHIHQKTLMTAQEATVPEFFFYGI